jgi:hypothetical protein
MIAPSRFRELQGKSNSLPIGEGIALIGEAIVQ